MLNRDRGFHGQPGRDRIRGLPAFRQGNGPSRAVEHSRLLHLCARSRAGRASAVQRRGFRQDRYYDRALSIRAPALLIHAAKRSIGSTLAARTNRWTSSGDGARGTGQRRADRSQGHAEEADGGAEFSSHPIRHGGPASGSGRGLSDLAEMDLKRQIVIILPKGAADLSASSGKTATAGVGRTKGQASITEV